MRLFTHLIYGILIASLADLFLQFSSVSYILLFYTVTAFTSILPDIDYTKGLRIIHRHMLHSLWLVVMLGIIGYAIMPFLVFPAVIGAATHLALDSSTREGIKLFYPFMRIKGKIRTGSWTEKSMASAALFLVIVLAFYNF